VIRAKCARILGNGADAADIAQEVFLRLCTSPIAHEPAAARLKWIYVTGTRLCIDHVRRRRLGVEVASDAAGPADGPGAAAPADDALAARQTLERLASALSPEDLEILVMTRCDRMTQDEVAAVLDISSRQVRRVIQRADAQLTALAARQE
jgi:RNA polymerase sigma factor (sigma-70 family)